MKVCLLSSSDVRGGAPIAAYRLHQGLRYLGVNSLMVVGEKTRYDEHVLGPSSRAARLWMKLLSILDVFPLRARLYPKPEMYSLQWLPDAIASKIAYLSPDLINMHWINGGYVQIETLATFQQPVVWTLHDMWAFTGGCHYNQECERYMQACGACPQLNSHNEQDVSRRVWKRKVRAWKHLKLTIVTPSQWLAGCARSSSLLQDVRIEVIPNSLDTSVYRPHNQQRVRQALKLSHDTLLILFGSISAASSTRKGFHLLRAAIQYLNATVWRDRIELVVVGASQPRTPIDMGVPCHYLGSLQSDSTMAQAYAAADVFVAPSLQDNLPNTVMEALACGVPCVAFNIGGMSDMIEHQQNGYLARPFETEDLAQGIIWTLEDRQRWHTLSQRSRQKVEQEFTLEIQARNYRKLFEEVLETTR